MKCKRSRKLSSLLKMTFLGVFFFLPSYYSYAQGDQECATRYGSVMTIAEAEAIAGSAGSPCLSVGALKDTHWCNKNTGTWWIYLASSLENCSPACVVDIVSRQASVNYMCTGVLPVER